VGQGALGLPEHGYTGGGEGSAERGRRKAHWWRRVAGVGQRRLRLRERQREREREADRDEASLGSATTQLTPVVVEA
jgi:hypothetical protein